MILGQNRLEHFFAVKGLFQEWGWSVPQSRRSPKGNLLWIAVVTKRNVKPEYR
jgi:hypothetical protein